MKTLGISPARYVGGLCFVMQRRLNDLNIMLGRLAQAALKRKIIAICYYSPVTVKALTVLRKSGLIYGFSRNGSSINVFLKFDIYGIPLIRKVTPLSTASKPTYARIEDFYRYSRFGGTTFISTNKGILSLQEAHINGVGGKLLFRVN